MKFFLKIFTALMCVCLLIVVPGCKKLEDAKPATDYDIANNIFRVHANTAPGMPYHIVITETGDGKSVNLIDVQQNDGGDFNYGFTPGTGNTVNVQIVAGNLVECYTFYKGTNLGAIDMSQTGEDEYSGQLSYPVNQ
jgi:hypothetical protein